MLSARRREARFDTNRGGEDERDREEMEVVDASGFKDAIHRIDEAVDCVDADAIVIVLRLCVVAEDVPIVKLIASGLELGDGPEAVEIDIDGIADDEHVKAMRAGEERVPSELLLRSGGAGG